MPNFMLIGAAKAGTTSLHYYLNQHPEVFFPKEKELQFFTDDALYEKGSEYYWKHYFDGAHRFPARGEATPFYLHRASIVIPRLKVFFPEPMKFIVILRDPVKRAWSHYQHMVRLGLEPLSFEQALKEEDERIRRQPTSWFSYFSDGLYAHQLEQWFDHYPRENFLVLTQDEMAADVHGVLKRIFSFLEVDADVVIPDLAVKNEASEARSRLLMKVLMGRGPASNWIKAMIPIHLRRRVGSELRQLNTKPVSGPIMASPESVQVLKAAYDHDVAKLELLLNRSFAYWRSEA